MRITQRHIWVACALWFGMCISQAAAADSGITLSRVSAPIKGGLLYLDAAADIRIPAGVRTALDNGVDLFLDTTIQILSRRKLLPDKRIAELKIRRRVSFHALTSKYTVDDLTFGTRKSFSSLSSALVYAGKYSDVSLLDVSLAKPFDTASMRMRIKLSRRDLPLALRLKSYVTRDWYLSSDWYIWPLQ